MKILAYAEVREGALKKNAFEAISAARHLAAHSGGSVTALLVGNGIAGLAEKLGSAGPDEVIVVEDERLAEYAPAAVARAIAEVAAAEDASYVVLSHTSHGKDLAPRVAVRLEAGLAPDVVSIADKDGTIVFSRPVYAGKAVTDISITTAKGVVSVRPNVYVPDMSGDGAPEVRSADVQLDDADFRAKVVETQVNTGKKDVADSDIVVSGGRGLKGPENFHLVEELAEALDAAVGASRAVVDAGWRPHSEQVGQTGKTVSPSLYVACAISGAVQHLAGMSSSKYIVAINKDDEAPIFGVADYGLVGDVFEVLPKLTEEIKAARG